MRQIQHFLLPVDLSQSRITVLDKELLHQMKTVLRFRVGEDCILLDGQGTKATARIEELHSKAAVLLVKDRTTVEAPKRRVRLYAALSKKPATFEWIVQKATELGVTDLIPLVTERCQVRELKKADRLHLIMKEACEQCERAYLPHLWELLSLRELLADLPNGLLLAGDAWIHDQKLKDIVTTGQDVNLVIGPEGGLSPEELGAIKQAGGTLFVLGDSVLRMETAVIAALSVLQFGD